MAVGQRGLWRIAPIRNGYCPGCLSQGARGKAWVASTCSLQPGVLTTMLCSSRGTRGPQKLSELDILHHLRRRRCGPPGEVEEDAGGIFTHDQFTVG